MTVPIEKIRGLLALADQDNEEGRSAAHTAIKLLKKHGYIITMSSREDPTPPAWQSRAWSPPQQPQQPQQPAASRRRWGGAMAIVADEVQKFFQTIDVLPRDIPVTGAQLAPAETAGFCRCGRHWRRGELASRHLPRVCAICVAKRNADR